MKKGGYSRGDLITIAAVGLAFATVCTVGLLAYVNRDNRWDPIVSPTNEKAAEIVGVTRLLQPYVRTEGGNYYFCSGSTWRDTCQAVTAADLPVNKIPGRWQTCAPVFPRLPALPGQPVNTLDVGQCQEGRTYARLVVLENGSIWKWQRTFSWVNGFAMASGIVWSVILGVLAGVSAVRVRRYLNSPVPGTAGGAKPVSRG